MVYNFDTRKFEDFLTKNMPEETRKKYLDRDFSSSTMLRRSGFIAQEVEKAANEVNYNFDAIHKPENENDNYSLAYGQFVVPLVKAVQELSKQNEEQLKINDSLKKEINDLRDFILNNQNNINVKTIQINKASVNAQLFQNTPNPFNQSTVIRYTLPSNSKKAAIVITSLNGIKVKEFDLSNRNGQSFEMTGGLLSAGTYIYSLIVDGKFIDSKKMILTSN